MRLTHRNIEQSVESDLVAFTVIWPASLLSQTSETNPAHRPKVAEAYGSLPLYFERNVGQTDSKVKFLSRGAGYGLFLTSTEAVLDLQSRSAAPSDPKAWLQALKTH